MYMTQGLRQGAKNSPDGIAMVTENGTFTWGEFRDRVARLAGALHALAMKSEDRVAMLAFNSHRYAEYYYGTFWAGANVVPMNIRWSLPEHVYSINDSGARFLIVDDTFAEMGASIARECASVEIRPLRNRPKSVCESVDSMRITSERVVISSEKTATFLP